MIIFQRSRLTSAARKVCADRIDQRDLPANKQMARAVKHHATLLLGGLGRDKVAGATPTTITPVLSLLLRSHISDIPSHVGRGFRIGLA